MDPETLNSEAPEAAEPDPEAPPPPAASPDPQRSAAARPPSLKPDESVEVAKAQKRREHMERALKATGRAAAKTDDAETEEAEEEETEADPDAETDKAPEKETAAQKSERLAKLDKVKSHKHLAKALERHTVEVKALEDREKKHQEQQAKDDRINQAATREYGPYAQARHAYVNLKDYRGAKAAAEGIFQDKFENIARNFWNATKDGNAAADIRHELNSLKAQLAQREEQGAQAKQVETKTSEEKQLRSTFDKRTKGHDLAALGDEELSKEAFDKWRSSWDEDLGEYTMTSKKAADLVLEKHRTRAAKLSGKRATPAARTAPRETKDVASTKPLREMSKEEKKIYHRDRAVRAANAAKRERERHA